MAKGNKREEVVVSLQTEPRLHMDLLVVGNEGENGEFPTANCKFVLRKFVMTQSKRTRRAEIWEITIPQQAADELVDGIQRVKAALHHKKAAAS